MRNAIRICEGEDPLVVTGAGCPNIGLHTPAPLGYGAWHDWAERMSRTHRQRRCAGCGLFQIWVRGAKRKAASRGRP